MAKTFKNQEAAEGWLMEKLTEYRSSGEVFRPSEKSLEEFLGEWLETARGSLRPASIAVYGTIIQKHLVPSLGMIPLAKLTPARIQKFYNLKREDGTGSRTQSYCHATLHRALSFAVRMGYLRENPCDRVERPRHEARERRPLSTEELIRFLEAAADHRLGTLFLMAATTGARRGELLGLRWKDIDIDAGIMAISRQLIEVAGKKAFGDLKTKASRRPVPLLPEVVESLRRHRLRQLEERLAAGPEWKDQDLVFATATGGPLQPNNIARRTFRELLETAEIDSENVSFHSLRHTAATNLIAGGATVKDTQGLLGHSLARTTMERYAHVVEDSKRLAVEKAATHLLPKAKKN
jgi:integrase